MKKINCISNAFTNIFYKKSYALRMITGIAFITAIIQSSFLILQVIQNYYTDTINKNIINNAVSFNTTVSEQKDISESDKEIFDFLNKTENTAPPVCRIPLDTMRYINDTTHKYIKLSRTSLICNGKEYKGKQKSMYSVVQCYTNYVSFDADLYLSEYDIVDINTKKQFEYTYPGEELFLYGSTPKENREVVINSYIVSHYGIENPDDIIGKTISFSIDGKEYIKDLKVAGIINEKYFNMQSTAIKNYIMIYDSIENISDYCSGGEDAGFYVPINNLLNNAGVYETIQQSGLENKVICSEDSLKGLSYTEKLSEVSKKVLSVICVFIIFSLTLGIFSIIKTSVISSRKYYGMLSAIGMNRRTLFFSFFSEQILLIFASVLLAFPLYEVFVIIINKTISAMITDEIAITVSQLLRIYSVSSLLCLVIISGISCFAFSRSIPKNITDALK